MSGYAEISSLLIDLEAAMRNSGLWASEQPAPEALASTQPFCVDTLALEEWLQFVFIPRIRAIIAAETNMPAKCEIKPWWKRRWQIRGQSWCGLSLYWMKR